MNEAILYLTHHCPTFVPRRMAVITAAKAVAMALTPGLEVIRKVTLWSQKRGLGPQVEFLPSHENLDNWHPEEVEIMDFRTNFKVRGTVRQRLKSV